jgi:hypothetical protein
MSCISDYHSALSDLSYPYMAVWRERRERLRCARHVRRARARDHRIGVSDWMMARVHARRNWYLLPDNSYESLEAYIDATRAALVADVRAYQAEVAAFESAHRKRRREALKAECAAAASPVPERAQPARASKRTRGSA